MADQLAGIGVSRGVAAGPVARMAAAPVMPTTFPPVNDPAAENEQATAAFEAVAADLEARGAAAGGDAQGVLQAQALMARDPAVAALVAKAIAAGEPAPRAVAHALGEFRAMLAAAGPYLAERVADLDDIQQRTVARLLGLPMPGIPQPGHPYVLVATDLSPADTATLDPALVLAVVTEQGGPTSHTAILATSLGLPAVVACSGATGLADGEQVLVDGGTGVVLVSPAPDVVATALAAHRARVELLGRSSGPGRTSDGVHVKLLVNIGADRDLAAAASADAEGVGLFRTEFLFLDRPEAPTRAEQQASYTAVFDAFAGRKVVVRTLDAGADKPLRFVTVPDEPNPALGVRGVRTARRLPGLLDDQLAAIAAAAAASTAEVWVMAPMVSTAAEARAFADLAHGHGLALAGVMVEVPAAALRARHVLQGCDFVSLGTNDLGQYTLAADRMAGDLADLLDPWQPAVLELVQITASAAGDLGKPVGVCGESASDPALALVLVGLGVTSLSMAPGALPGVRTALAAHSIAECQHLATLALLADGAVDGRAAVQAAARL